MCFFAALFCFWAALVFLGKDMRALYIGIAFGLFGVSHLGILVPFGVLVVRLLAYFMVILSLCKFASK
jgi:hypothetical protein